MDDAELLNVLRDVLAAEADVPARTREAARSAGRWVQAVELAEVLFDSTDSPALAGIRSGAPRRQLSYRVDDLILDCEVGDGTLVAQVAPPLLDGLDLVSADGTLVRVSLDDVGRCIAHPPAGPFSIRARRAGRPDVVTPWLMA